jgi:esterase/lipase superfamily enzyme
MSYGKGVVSVPKTREVGTIERPSSRAEAHYDEYRFDPGRHFIIKTVDIIDSRELFIDDLTEAIDLSQRKEALVFIHGYNTSFADALIQTAQLAVDLEIDGAAVVYSWPSRASLWSYIADRNQLIGPFLDDLKALIASVATSTGAARVHLIAHSMGGKFLLEALADLAACRT